MRRETEREDFGACKFRHSRFMRCRIERLTMTLRDIEAQLETVLPRLRAHGVAKLSVFGSVAQGVARADSDIDFLVEFAPPSTSDTYFGTLFLLEDVFQRKIDLVEPSTLHARIREKVIAEAIRVA